MSDCIFCKIVEGKIPSRKVYEDDDLLAFLDINPAAPVHVLVIPKQHVESLADCTPEHAVMLGKLFGKLGEIARAQGLTDGFRTIVNTGRVGGQEVYHLHAHILGGPQPVGPMLVRH
ncbi:MAG: histidine triad nucleotide-binding protein [Rhodocyclaceae bacterium]|nr:histidine triad nucleotide-binding protein [Rhodocyclaceae bacterium]